MCMASVHAKRITMAVVVIRIGLTGGIAAGKSTVSAKLCELGAVLVDYDLLARRVVEPGSIGLQRIAECFGSDALTDRGELNRAWMAEHVFSGSDAERKRKMLDGIEHPLIYELAVLKQYVEPLLFQITPDMEEYHEAKRLLKFLDYFLGIGTDRIPANSLLREFIGGGCFDL